MSNQIDKIYNYCFRILGLKPYTESEIRKKIQMRFKDIQVSEIEEVVEKLKELKYINDLQFAIDYVYFRLNVSPRGKFLLKRELFKKGVDGEIIDQVLEEAEIDEEALVKQLVEYKSKALQGFDLQKRREKLMRFLQSRGFGYAVIKKVL